MTMLERATACLVGVATGDAVGKQAEGLDPEQIDRWYPGGITGFHGRPGSVIPRYIGARTEWRIGETTDDTEQTIAVARALLVDRRASHGVVGHELMGCRKSNRPALSLGRFQQQGDPDRICYEGDSCGSAMRAAPIGIVHQWRDPRDLVAASFESSLPTHGGQAAICGVAAVAAAVSAAIDGQAPEEILGVATAAAREAEKYRPPASDARLADDIADSYRRLVAARRDLPSFLRWLGRPPQRTAVVPLAISLALVTGSAEETTVLAANAGGDADTVAAIGAGIAGAMAPGSINEGWDRVVREVNGHDLPILARCLAALRQSLGPTEVVRIKN